MTTINPELKPLPPTDNDPSGYTVEQYPHLVGDDDSNWQIYANADGSRLASIATQPGCKSTHYGDVNHLKRIIVNYNRRFQLTPYGAELLGERFLSYVQGLN